MQDWQRSCVKLSGQCSGAFKPHQAVRWGCYLQASMRILDGMTNICELLINIVTSDKPKMLTGLDQKVCGRLPHELWGYTDIMTAGE